MLEAKPVKSSRVTLSQLMQPEHANLRGDVHGGAIDQMMFHKPIRIGDLVMFNAELTYVGRTSMEVRVSVVAEDPVTGSQSQTNTAYLVYVALDDERRPRPVPGLLAETEVQKRRMQEGEKRQEYRLANRQEDEDTGQE
jgi:acyl-CoA hydrolase